MAIPFMGILNELFDDEDVTEIMVNGSSSVYFEKRGTLRCWDKRFKDDNEIFAIITAILAPLGKQVNHELPCADGRLDDGSRVNVVIPPVSLSGPMLTIRRFPRQRPDRAFMVNNGTLSDKAADFLTLCAQLKVNLLVSGGTGSGKTTLLNVLSSFVPENERIITIEDTAELHTAHAHTGRLEARAADADGKHEISVRRLLINALRMRPDRIIVGECRAGEALDMLQAMNTGHRGSMATLHANSPRDCLKRLETMVFMAGFELPLNAVRGLITAAAPLLIQTDRFPDGARKVTALAEVTGMEGDIITLAPIFEYTSGSIRPTGIIPAFIEKARGNGIAIDREMFA